LKAMIRALKNGDIIWYAPDHDYGPKSSVFVPIFAVDQAASTKGSYLLIRSGNPAVIPFVPRRMPDGKGYEMVILPEETSIPLDDEAATAARMNRSVEHGVLMAPDQY
ncbi:lipid A biosynthesis lauroyl acyltransferase, partial [Erwinia amylovora]|nr:lipid A biosynthesis lauroyl acyltransferase [Erwinia amylovora]